MIKRLYKAERELFTHCLTFVVLMAMIGSAGYVDARLQPKEAQANLVQVVNNQVDQKKSEEKPEPKADTAPAPEPEPIVVDEADPNLPPPLTEGTQGLSPELVQRFDAFRTFIFQEYNVVLEIRSGYRSYEEQAMLYRTLPAGRANPPGQSNHETGESIDYTNYSVEHNQHLGIFGLKAPFPGKEDWHIQRVEVG